MEMQNVDNGRSEGVIAERRRVRADQPFQNEALQRHTGAQPASMAQAVAMATSRWHDMMYQREAARSKENEVAEKALGLLQHALKLEQHRSQSPSDGEYRGRCRRQDDLRHGTLRSLQCGAASLVSGSQGAAGDADASRR